MTSCLIWLPLNTYVLVVSSSRMSTNVLMPNRLAMDRTISVSADKATNPVNRFELRSV